MGSFFLTSKKASATLVFLVISILVVSSGVIITNQIKKSNEDNVAGTGLVLLDNEQDTTQDSDSSDDQIKFAFGDSEGRISSKKSSGGGGSSKDPQTYNEPETLDNDEIVDDQTFENQTETNYTGEINESEAFMKNGTVISSREVMGPDVGWCQPSYCEAQNRESAEGPGGSYCCSSQGGSSGYEECTDYRTKSTVYIYDYWTGNFKFTETDYCSGSNTLQEAYMDCQLWATDRVLWKEKDCNDYDGWGGWYYYCTSTQVRKKERDFGCADGRCKFIEWKSDQLVSQKGDGNYCAKRKQYDCSLCGHGDYDCDSDSQCSGNLECMGPLGDWNPSYYDGCCKEGERWDSTNNRCCECGGNLGGGSCCLDGCHYNPSSTICHYYLNYQYGCKEGNCLGDDVYRRRQVRYCSGLSQSCNGNIGWDYGDIWGWSPVHDYCSFSNEFCDGTAEGSWTSTSFSCSTTQCTSGVCCDTDCGEYSFLSTNSPCGSSLEFGCPYGEGTSNPGADVYSRTKTQYCSGSYNLCNGAYGSWSGWSPYDYCTLDQYCTNGDPTCNSCGYHTHWACHENDVYYYDDCNNLEDIKYECGITGCSNGQCNPEIACYNDSGCGEDGPIGDPWCSNDDAWQEYINYTCYYPGEPDAYCSNYTSNQIIEDCPEDSYSDNYCHEDDVYQNFTDRGCLDGACFENTTAQFVQECGEEGCSDGECVYVECYNDSECGPDNDYIGDPFCQNGDVWQNKITHTCNYAGTGNSYCSNSTAPDLKEPCGTDYCENWGSNYCNLDDLYHERTCHDKGCSGGVCFDDTYIEEEKVQECGTSEYIGSSYCYNDDVYRDYITRTCSNSRCISPTSEKKVEDCAHGCISERCKIEVCNYGGCYYF